MINGILIILGLTVIAVAALSLKVFFGKKDPQNQTELVSDSGGCGCGCNCGGQK